VSVHFMLQGGYKGGAFFSEVWLLCLIHWKNDGWVPEFPRHCENHACEKIDAPQSCYASKRGEIFNPGKNGSLECEGSLAGSLL